MFKKKKKEKISELDDIAKEQQNPQTTTTKTSSYQEVGNVALQNWQPRVKSAIGLHNLLKYEEDIKY